MSLPGPIHGRNESRRSNNSIIGFRGGFVRSAVSKDQTIRTANSNFGNTNLGGPEFGIRTLAQHESDTYRDKFRGYFSGTNAYTGTGNDTSEIGGGGSVGEAHGGGQHGSTPTQQNMASANFQNMYCIGGSTRVGQASWPPKLYKHTMNDMVDMYHSTVTANGWGNYLNTQGFKDLTSSGALWRYRQIINVCYTFAGYKSGSPWKSVHRTYHHNDQSANLGDNLDYPGSYTSGGNNATTYFLFSTPTDNAHSTSSSRMSAFHMYNETSKSHNSAFDMYNSRMDLGTVFKEHEVLYIFGGGPGSANVDKFNMTTECRQGNLGLSALTTQCSAFSDKDYGYAWDNGGGRKMNYSNDTAASSTQWGQHGQQKGIPSKHRLGYGGNEGEYSGGYTYRQWNLTNDTNAGNVGRPRQNNGEENFSMGQDWQYMMGEYNGLQNNGSHKWYYASSTGVADPSGTAPTAHAGQSSGHCGWRV